ncbi:MAG TPA: iron-sulfur cluster assembly scaffold protein [Steroidobacteraceae bacterium]|jgi:NifU-like protein involved in Fe-S cluster formation
MNYNELTRRYFESPAGAGVLSGPGVSRGSAGSVEIGTWVQFDLQIGAATLQAARFLAFGCPHTIAVAAWLVEQAPGRALTPALPETVQALSTRFAVPVPKLGRLLIVEDAWVAAATRALDRVNEA